MRILIAAIAGALFGLGLVISGMTDPAKVLGFLDVAGAWDPTLAFVMGGAVLVMVPAWRLTRMRTPIAAESFPPAPTAPIDGRLLGGSTLFGLGWGLVGLCPGPALAALAFGGTSVWIFAAAMLAGMTGFEIAEGSRAHRAS